MPVLKHRKDPMPSWCELEHFDIVELPTGATHTFQRIGRKEKLIVGKGQCQIALAGRILTVEERANLDLLTVDGQFEVLDVLSDTTLIRMCGRWEDETGGSGLFTVKTSEAPQDSGDPVDYPKTTNFDNHYHDCDEYWILFEGRGIAVSEGKAYEVGPGDCVATGMGYHHDFPEVFEPVRAVYFETTLEGQKRLGHLWNHRHGPTQSQKGRV
jgi:mannose-6-phosphate isomerase-like protein (cupin superfamily)